MIPSILLLEYVFVFSVLPMQSLSSSEGRLPWLGQTESTQPTFTCSNLTIEAMEKGVKYVQSNDKNSRTTLVSLSGVFVINPEHISCLLLLFLY